MDEWMSPEDARCRLAQIMTPGLDNGRQRVKTSSEGEVAHIPLPTANPSSLTGKTVYIVRHGESIANRAWEEGDTVGMAVFDAPLTEKGKAQALNAGKVLASLGLNSDVVFAVSPLTRTLQTMLYAQEGMGSSPELNQIEVVPCMAEHCISRGDVGRYRHMLLSEFPSLSSHLRRYLPDGNKKWWFGNRNCPIKSLMEEVEPHSYLENRIKEFKAWCAAREEKVIVAVGHSTFYFHLLRGTRKRMKNCEVIGLQM